MQREHPVIALSLVFSVALWLCGELSWPTNFRILVLSPTAIGFDCKLPGEAPSGVS
jgi:hypothetical protein